MNLTVGTAEGVACAASYGDGPASFTLATGSPGELGLVKALAQAFAPEAKARLGWVKAGSGESFGLLKGKQVDLVMVHAPAQVQRAVKEGWAVQRTLIGSNEFYLVGPKRDPAGVRKAADAAEAYALIAKARAKFITRADNSGTHKKELAIWAKAGIRPEGAWYLTNRDFMLATLRRADELGAYFMTDSSTWFLGSRGLANLTVLFRGDPTLVNTYHALRQPDGATPGAGLAGRFLAFLAAPAGQAIIGGYGRQEHGQALYHDAAYASRYDR